MQAILDLNSNQIARIECFFFVIFLFQNTCELVKYSCTNKNQNDKLPELDINLSCYFFFVSSKSSLPFVNFIVEGDIHSSSH